MNFSSGKKECGCEFFDDPTWVPFFCQEHRSVVYRRQVAQQLKWIEEYEDQKPMWNGGRAHGGTHTLYPITTKVAAQVNNDTGEVELVSISNKEGESE